MARMQIRVSKRIVFIWFTLAALILLFSPQKLTSKLQFAFARIFNWPLRISRSLSLSAQTKKNLNDAIHRREYDQLRNHLERLEELLKQEHKKVELLVKYRDRLPLAGAGIPFAGIISSIIDGSNGKLIINRGTEDGLVKGQFVIADNSIIGEISQVSARTAKVTLTTDPAFKIPVTIPDLNVNRFLVGKGNNLAKIELLETTYKIKVGHFVQVQLPGLDGPMVIGKIKNFQRDSQKPLLWDVTIEPACRIENLLYVNVIIPNPKE
jgi:rod shape-determining protein MreC